MDDNSLAHYGIKGMRWGVRKRTPLQRSARRVIKAEAKWRASPEYSLSRRRAYRRYKGKQAVYDVKALKARSLETKLTIGEKSHLRKAKVNKAIYRSAQAAKIGTYASVGVTAIAMSTPYSKTLLKSARTGIKLSMRGVQIVNKSNKIKYSTVKNGIKAANVVYNGVNRLNYKG